MTGEIAFNKSVANGIYAMEILSRHEFCRAGQFAQISVPGAFLRRPISVSDWGDGWFRVIYRVVGEGTKALSQMKPGDGIKALTGLGNGFVPGKNALVIAGGMGVAPMLALCRRLSFPDVALGFKTASEMYLTDEIAKTGARVTVATQDGTFGEKGLVTDIVKGEYENVYVCGPTAMMKAVYRIYPDAFFSLEAHMACGYGACMGCSIDTKSGMKRVCADGPVFRGGELLWQTRA